ncbi:hypothetical protein EUX98_g3465 [Antrodiella citrinella]|uniref:Uncharacterized protein n=1 Tax=Antrodiella citrinella TaxID=2447956 RepID=A0A4S4MXM6_9APHY|nr:hypothetical protein EUX98_g3465 [Antrodiella citrinella]
MFGKDPADSECNPDPFTHLHASDLKAHANPEQILSAHEEDLADARVQVVRFGIGGRFAAIGRA